MSSTDNLKDRVAILVDLLRSHRFRFSSEVELQDMVERVLKEAEIPHQREWDLGVAGRIDFFVYGDIGLEIKTKGSPTQVAAQVLRYCERDEIDYVVLLTARMTLSSLLPEEAHGKRIVTVGTWENMI